MARKIQASGTILILLDCEDDCPATLAPQLLQRAQRVRSDVNISVVLAYREFETWFLTAAESLRSCCNLAADLMPPAQPEAIRGAKEWLAERMSGKYSETIDQARLAARMNLELARQSPSFDKLYREMEKAFSASSSLAEP